MGIRNIQMTRAVEKIIRHYLKYGRYPTFQTITHHLSHWLREHTPGAPTFKPLKFLRKETSDPSRYNKNIDMIYTDLSDAYQATIEQTKKVISNFSYIETERKKLWHELSVLSKEIDELIMLAGNADFKHFSGQIISFEDMSLVDSELTTAFVDVENQQVTLKENLAQTKIVKINGHNAKFSTLMPAAKTEALDSIHNAFDNNLNTAWWQVVKTKTPGSLPEESSMGMRAELTIMFDQEEEFNEIRYVAHHGKPVYTKIEFTVDGKQFIPLPDKNNYRKVVNWEAWQFQKIKAKGIKFIFEKKEHDDRSAGVYQYYFGAKDISVLNKSYMSESVFYSKPVEFLQPVKEISALLDDDIPFNTSIDYEIALYDPTKTVNELTWFPISSYDDSQPKYARIIEFSTKYVRTIETSKAEPTGEIKNGMKVFRLMKDNGDGIISEIMTDINTGEEEETFDIIKNAKLFRGINQWKREKCYVPFDGTIPLNSKWSEIYNDRPHMVRTDYLPIGNTLALQKGNEGMENFYRFTTCLYMDEPKSQPLSLSVVHTTSSGDRKRLGVYSVYLNNERVIPSHDEVTLELKKGWNEIQILYHWGDLQRRSDLRKEDLPNETYLGKFSFARHRKVRADLVPLKYVDVHSLFHNISPNNHDYFSIYERQIVLNYLPENCIFQLMYEADMDPMSDINNQVIVKATLKRNPDIIDITPKIKRIRLRAK
jgi:chaperonin cofactor prefoldin